MEFEFNVQKVCQCNKNGYGHMTADDEKNGMIDYPSMVMKVKVSPSVVTFRLL